ncbi:MAG: helix-turn-helix domain-containing protein [Chitinophagaceae bacterium]
MKRLTIQKPDQVKEQIMLYLNGSEELKFSHKLHGVLLLLENTNCCEVSRIYGSTPQSLAAWVHKLNQGEGGNIKVLKDQPKPGRSQRISVKQIKSIKYALSKKPTDYGIQSLKWSGIALSQYLKKEYGVELKIRMCQRWMQRLKNNQAN